MRVLLLEDQECLRNATRKGLEEMGFVVDAVADGDVALNKASSAPYDALVLDIMVPGRDGLSLLRVLRERKNATPVILPVTAFQVLVMNFAYALMAEHDVRGVDAVRLALKGIAANLLPCLRLGLVTMAASVLGLLLCGVGIFLALPFVHGLVYLAHREIFGAAPRAVAAD